MNDKETTEEFIRTESKTEYTDTQLEAEFDEVQEERDFIETGMAPELPCIQAELEQPLQVEPQSPDPHVESELSRTVMRTEFDAVHPRFRQPKKPEVIEEFQNANDYYCEQCKLYFAPDIVGLKTHFRSDMVKHQPIDECFYCKGAVYAYTFNKERQIYHNCEDGK